MRGGFHPALLTRDAEHGAQSLAAERQHRARMLPAGAGHVCETLNEPTRRRTGRHASLRRRGARTVAAVADEASSTPGGEWRCHGHASTVAQSRYARLFNRTQRSVVHRARSPRATLVNQPDASGERWAFNINANAVREVVLGCRCDQHLELEAQQLLRRPAYRQAGTRPGPRNGTHVPRPGSRRQRGECAPRFAAPHGQSQAGLTESSRSSSGRWMDCPTW